MKISGNIQLKILAFLGMMLCFFAPQTSAEKDKSLTVMVYMIGSDLESGAGAATADLQEMEDAGADLSAMNLLVYTGGSEKWHSDVDGEKNTVQVLTADGFESRESFDLMSMGESESLTRFLDYAVENFPAEDYALILWDHGNGPLVGYGLDKLYENDSLTLQEIGQALEDSPFGAEKKLELIGFDACLMASAELAAVVSDYADYLVASQETEPSFGWNYEFLGNASALSGEKLCKEITECYLKYCEDYYDQKEKYRSDVTLSAVDLSKMADLENALNALFKDASEEVSGDYSALAQERVRTRALGRASTGSEYDLVDLDSLMEEMSADYKKQTDAVRKVLNSMIVSSCTNTEGVSGLSIYYPCYNKKYYEKVWGSLYAEMNIFPEYVNYLSRYSQIWLGTDLQEYFEDGLTASEEGGSYRLQLTEEQNEAYAYARYYILRKMSDNSYSLVYTSNDVTNEDGLLTAGFDGKIIYYRSDWGIKGIPVCKQMDSVGNTDYYTTYPYVNDEADLYMSTGAELQFAVNRDTEEVTIKAIYENDDDADEEALSTGKRKELSIDDFKVMIFMNIAPHYLTRDSSGKLLDYWDWPYETIYTGEAIPSADGLYFSYEPIYDDGYEYFIMFDVMDVQNSHCTSELLPIVLQKNEDPEEEEYVQEAELRENGGVIYEENGVRISLYLAESPESGADSYVFLAENENDFPVTVKLQDFLADDTSALYGYIYFSLDEHERAVRSSSDLMQSLNLQGIEKAESVSASIQVTNEETQGTMDGNKRLVVTLGKNLNFERITVPVRGMIAGEQELYHENGVRITLLAAGGFLGEVFDLEGEDSAPDFLLKIENESEKETDITVNDISVNGETCSGYYSCSLKSGRTAYTVISSYGLRALLNSETDENPEITMSFRLTDEDYNTSEVQSVIQFEK